MISVTSYHNKDIKGCIYQPHLDLVIEFDNLMQMLLQMEAMMDEAKYPQREREPRPFREDGCETTIQGVGLKMPTVCIANLQVEVLFRQHASWQGKLIWQDRDVQANFRSALELFSLMNDVLEIAAE